MGSLNKNIQLMLEFLKIPFLVLHFSYYTLITSLMMLSVILISMLIILSILRVISHLICGNNQDWPLNLNLIHEARDWGRKWLADFNAELVSFDQSNNSGAINVKMDTSVLKKKSFFKILGLTFSSKLDWGSYIISLAKSVPKKIGALICSIKFLSPEVALYLYKSTIQSCMEYCCHIK